MPLMRNKQEAQTPIDMRHWHVLYTRHQHEKPVARILSSKGHEVFLPLYAVTHRWQDRTKRLCLPVMSSSVVGWTPNSKSPVRLEYLPSWDGQATLRRFPTDRSNGYAKWSRALFASSRIPI